MTTRSLIAALFAAAAVMWLAAGTGRAGQTAQASVEPPAAPAEGAAEDEGETMIATATFGAGCFWGVEAAFQEVEGVVETVVGYSGGVLHNPTYQEVCSHRTGHAEVVLARYDPSVVSYDELLDVFWSIHDPTQHNRQGPDVGSQYRSVIFYHTPEQKAAALASKKRLEDSGRYSRLIATQIGPAETFWRAEDYHQKYLQKRGAPSCHI